MSRVLQVRLREEIYIKVLMLESYGLPWQKYSSSMVEPGWNKDEITGIYDSTKPRYGMLGSYRLSRFTSRPKPEGWRLRLVSEKHRRYVGKADHCGEILEST